MNANDEPLSDQAFHQLLAINRIARQHARQLSDEQGLRPREQSVLRFLMENDAATVGQLQQFLHNSPSTTSALVAKLENAGLVIRARSSLDNRVVLVTLTPKGQERLHHTPLGGFPLLRKRLEALPEVRLAEINDALTEILVLMGGPDNP